MGTGVTSRWFIAVLAVIGMQVCCCRLGIGAPCQATAGAQARGTRDFADEHLCCGDPADEGKPPRPSGPCSKDDRKAAPEGTVKLDMAVAAASVAWVEGAWSATEVGAGHARHAWPALLKPPTPLLRQHCALIV